MSEKGPIFIGGTGRSGTTLLQQILEKHPEIFCIPFESRFIIDTPGIIDLVHHLSDGWTSANGDMVIRRFSRLMLIDLKRRWTFPYRGFSLSKFLGEPFYSQSVRAFIGELAPITYKGRTALRRGYLPQQIFHAPKRLRTEIIAICAAFIDSLFSQKMKKEGKIVWAEKTPHNILHIGFLTEMFPSARFINVYRDPRDIVASLLTKPLAPNDVRSATDWLISVYEGCDEQRREFPDVPIFNLKLEALVEKPEAELDRLVDFLKLGSPFDLSSLNLTKSNTGRWITDIEPSDQDVLQERLSNYIEQYGYSDKSTGENSENTVG